ncbi:hypothetical protein [Streptomyces phaeochromogenes]|uniref:hypothetical protein n=1 Tax=Streptomyces phaeochromogenes TaxID=1923 RepID=UPI0033DB078D|nr:hypothetical protein OG478_42025 [Streptomyces phaeochromogenes]WSW13158.1 hypothetical protein OG277_09150 [Streptomyces phaeochromogenes]
MTAVLASISSFRKESLWTNREQAFLKGVDTTTGLLHIEQVRRSAALAPHPAGDRPVPDQPSGQHPSTRTTTMTPQAAPPQ